jgi:hypothetical protein
MHVPGTIERPNPSILQHQSISSAEDFAIYQIGHVSRGCNGLYCHRANIDYLSIIGEMLPQLWQILLIRLAMAMIVRMGGLPKDLGSRLASATYRFSGSRSAWKLEASFSVSGSIPPG